MKKLIFTVIISALTFGVYAQGKIFNFPEDEGEQLAGQYIVIEEKGTPLENFNKVINYVNKTYNTPSEVIKSQIEGEYIRIEGISDLFRNMGVLIPAYHSLEFKFKQDRIKMTVNRITSTGPTPISISAYCTYDYTHDKKGKIRTSKMNYAIRVINGVNELAEKY